MLLVLTVFSLSTQGLNLGIDFEGGIVWDVPASSFTIEDAEAILRDNGIDPSEAQIQERSSDSGDLIKIQVADQPAEVRERAAHGVRRVRRGERQRDQRQLGELHLGS